MRISDYQDRLLAAPMTVSYVLSEVVELGEALLALDWSGVCEEWSDVGLGVQILLRQLTGWDWEVRWGAAAATKFAARVPEWERIFAEHGMVFEVRYWVNGSNYAKPAKVQMALELARWEVQDDE